MAKIGFIEVDITADVSHIRAGLASASSLIRDFSLLSIGLTSGINNAFKKISAIGLRAFQASLIGVTGVLVGATIEGAAFEDAMRRTFIMIGKGAEVAAEDILLLTERARELGRDTLFSATQAAEGMQILARAGFTVGQIFDSITPILELAIGTNIEMAESADMVVSALYGFGLAADEAGHLADVMATIVTSSNAVMQDLAETLSYIAPLATSVGWSIEETGAAIMMLANAGLKGSRAATGLRASIAKMLAPTQGEQKLLKELGIEFVDSAGNLRDFDKILQDLGRSNVKTTHIFKLFGRRAATAMEILRKMGPTTLKDFTAALEKSEGAANSMSQQMRTTFRGRVRDLTASIKLLGETIYSSYSEPLTDATFSLRNLIVAVTSAIKENGTFQSVVKGILGLLERYGITFKEMQKRIVEFIEALTPEKIVGFFDMIREKIDRAKETVIDFVRIAVEGIMESLPLGINVAIKSISKLINWWSTLSDDAKTLTAKVTGVTTAFLWLTGGLTPLILLFITLSSVIGSLVHIHIAAAITKSLVYAKVLGILKITAMGLVWVLGAVGAVIAGWNIGKWISDMKLWTDATTTYGEAWTEIITKIMARWDIFVAHIRNGAYQIAEIIFDYVLSPLQTLLSKLTGGRIQKLSEMMGLKELKEFGAKELEAARFKYKYVEDMLAQERARRGAPVTERPRAGEPAITGLDIEALREQAAIEDAIRAATGGQSELARLQEEHAAHLAEIAQLEAEGWTTVVENEKDIVGKYKIIIDQLKNITKEMKGIERESGHYIGSQLPGQVD